MRFIALAIATWLLLPSADARAQNTSTDSIMAEQLFDEGKRLVESKQFDKACPKFAESMKLDPGTGTLIHLAMCHEGLGKTATAWVEFREALSRARAENREDRQAFVKSRIDNLEPRLTRLQVNVPASIDVQGFTLTRDGIQLGKAVWGSAVPIDPGTHILVATAPRRVKWELKVDASIEGMSRIVDVPPMKIDDPDPIPNLVSRKPASEVKPVKVPQPTKVPTSTKSTKTNNNEVDTDAAWTLGGASVIVAAIGTVFTVRAVDNRTTRDALIGGGGLGLGLLGGGIAWSMLASSDKPDAPQVRIRTSGTFIFADGVW